MIQPEIIIRQVSPPGPSVRALMGDGFAKPSMDGGWEVVDRPKRTGFVNWKGYSPIQMDMPVVLDGFAKDESVESQVNTLFRIMRTQVGPDSQPAVVQIGGMPIPYSNLRWVIQQLDIGTELRRRSDGARTRVIFTMTMLEYIAGDVIIQQQQSPAKASQQRQAAAPVAAGKTYTVKSGDTLSAIAKRLLGNSDRWHDIANANGIRDPRALHVGQILRLPS